MPTERALLFDRYLLQTELGHGGFAKVVLAWDSKLGRRVAIKQIKLASAGDAEAAVAEARTAALLNFPQIVSIYDFEQLADSLLIIMEAVDGPNLAQFLLSQHTLLDFDCLAAIIQAVVAALTYAHENGVLHLDIKPANVLIAQNGHVKVADFGMARLLDSSGEGFANGGTIGYMPYEQLRGFAVSPATDEWALASLCYYLLTGQNPFLAPDLVSAQKLVQGEVVLPSELRPDLTAGVDEVLLQGLDLLPRERFQSVEEFWQELSPYLGKPRSGTRRLKDLLAAQAE
jgi:serine/threonine protein kinase